MVVDDENSELDFRRDVDPNSVYELTSLLGEGSYGAVYKAKLRDKNYAPEVAIKIIPDADDDLTSLWREIRFLQVLRSPYVVSFIESILFDNELWLVMELCDGGSLYDLKEAKRGVFDEEQLQAIMAFRLVAPIRGDFIIRNILVIDCSLNYALTAAVLSAWRISILR